MSRKMKTVLVSVIGVVLAGVLAAWGVLAWAANSQDAINRDYAGAVDELVAAAETLVADSASLVALSDALADHLGDAEKGLVSEVVGAGSELLASASMISVSDAQGAPMLVVKAALDRPDREAQSGDMAQSGGVSLSLAVMVDQLGLAKTDETAQSGEAQSGEAQSGDALVVASCDEDTDFTREDVEAVEALTVAVGQADADTVDAARTVITAAYESRYEAALANWVKANEALAAKIVQAEELLASSEGNVADDSVRSQLQDAVAAAKKVAEEEMPDSGLVSDLTRGTKTKAAKSLEAPIAAVDESVAAKKKADEEEAARVAAEQAAAEAAAEAARQAEANRAPSYDYDYGYDYGYSDNGGGGGGGGGYAPPADTGGGGGGYVPPADTGGDKPSWSIPDVPLGDYDPHFCDPPRNCAV